MCQQCFVPRLQFGLEKHLFGSPLKVMTIKDSKSTRLPHVTGSTWRAVTTPSGEMNLWVQLTCLLQNSDGIVQGRREFCISRSSTFSVDWAKAVISGGIEDVYLHMSVAMITFVPAAHR